MNVENVSLGVLERISNRLDLSWVVLEVNMAGKEKKEQQILIEQIEYEMASIGYDKNRKFPNESKDGVYHLHFMRGKPNA